MRTQYLGNLLPFIRTFCIAVVMTQVPRAEAIDIVVSGPPTETGSGSNLKARFHNVATVDGMSIDLFGEVVSQTSSKTNVFRSVGDNFKFQLQDGEPGENRSATVRWTFYRSGTNTPAPVNNLALTVDDLDDYAARTESIQTNNAISYTVDTPTNLIVNFSSGNLSARGGAKEDSGDPESAIKMYIESGSSFVITYTAVFRWEGNAGFIHDGDGDFMFDNPVVRLFYTYQFTNEEASRVSVTFSNSLPAGVEWDPEFKPQFDDALWAADLIFSDGHSTVSIPKLSLPPGNSRLTLGTREVTVPGNIENTATIRSPSTDSIWNASASISLP